MVPTGGLSDSTEAIDIGRYSDLPDDLVLDVAPGGRLTIGERVSIGPGSTIRVHRGATLAIGDDVPIGESTFISAMVGIRIGDGCALSDEVVLRDHRPRSVGDGFAGTPGDSRVEAAPIFVEPGATIAAEVTVTGGVRIGANALVGGHAVVSRSVAPRSVGATNVRGSAHTRTALEDRRTLTIGCFGTSITEHFEAFSPQMACQAGLPPVGSTVTVESWQRRGWVHRLALALRAARPHVTFDVRNHGEGGATSRDIASLVAADRATTGTDYDLVVAEMGINDVWRRFQGRLSEAVDLQEYTRNMARLLKELGGYTRRIVVLAQTPFGPVHDPVTVTEMNVELARYNAAAQEVAVAHGALFLDVWTPLTAAVRLLGSDGTDRVWSDGVHLSELGDTVVLQQVERFLAEHRILEDLLDYPFLERERALAVYGPLFARHRLADV
ncbi:GDSL-type esterase/lipase family protein [Streptacidiphilus sp. EB103A]|uniref:GDSL-type esterase/lipase family protein n=1 Tax=Streptacidiphilus sp. EB103A TaxID=3156275 RepID=UPI003514A9DE